MIPKIDYKGLHPSLAERDQLLAKRYNWPRLERSKNSKAEKVPFTKRPPIKVSRWAERFRFVHNSSRRGRWSNSTTPYCVGMMDASFMPSVKTVVIIKCPQSGGTESTHNCIGYGIDRAPGPVLYVYPDEITARENAADRIIPMLRQSPKLAEYLSDVEDDVSNLRINLIHTTIYMAWSGSASRLGNKPIRYLVLDELDKYATMREEAPPEALAEKRVITWGKQARIWKLSTPTIVGGPIDRAWKEAERRYRYHAVCPRCGAEMLMDLEHVCVAEECDDPLRIRSRELGRYECHHCGALWSDTDRDVAVRNGRWREEKHGAELMEDIAAERPVAVAFHVPAWISPFVSLSEIASKKLEYEKSPSLELLKDLRNNYEGRPWEPEHEERKEESVLALCDDRPRGAVPSPIKGEDGKPRQRVACLLGAVDTQKAYFRYIIRAFGYGDNPETWLIQEGTAPDVAALDALFWGSEYKDADGNVYKVSAVMIDAMGDPQRTAQVYTWATKNRGRVFPSQGVHAPSSPVSFAAIEYFPGLRGEKRKIPGGVNLNKVDTTMFKGTLAARLAIRPGDPGTFWLHSDPKLLEGYAREMTAETWNSERGLWDNPKKKPNHAWDCEYLAIALAWMLNVHKRPQPDDAAKRKQAPPRPAVQGQLSQASGPPRPPAPVRRNAGDKIASFSRRF